MIENVTKPWGKYETYYRDDQVVMKRLIVNPGEQLSLQSHKGRKEFWVVLQGTAELTIGEEIVVANINNSFIINKEQKHRISNSGYEILIIGEMGWGEVDEEDIVRYDDKYGRIKLEEEN